jgi:hypothetical protein
MADGEFTGGGLMGDCEDKFAMRVANKLFSAANVPEKAVSTRLGVGVRSIPTSITVHAVAVIANRKMERDVRKGL